MIVVMDERDPESCNPIGTTFTREEALQMGRDFAVETLRYLREREYPIKDTYEFYFRCYYVGHIYYKKRDVNDPSTKSFDFSLSVQELDKET